MRALISKKLENELILIREKLKNSVSIVDMINWLNNFKEEDQYYMVELLKRFRYFNDDEIIESYAKSMEEILNLIEDEEIIYINPIGEYGKSGTGMLYYLKKAIQGIGSSKSINRKKNMIKYIYNFNELEITGEKVAIIFLDDFLGSGHSAKEHYDDTMKYLPKNSRVIFLSFVCMDIAEEYLKKSIPNSKIIYSEIETKVFSTKQNTLGKREKIVNTREIVYKYTDNYKLAKKGRDYLGYDNSQCLLAFSFGTPNNTLPIFWNSKNGWIPLFPRFSKDKISKIKELRKSISFDLSIAYTLGINEFDFAKSDDNTIDRVFIKKRDYITLAIIKFKKERKSAVTICRLLGISIKEYEKNIENAIQKGILNKNEELTENGKKIYNDVRKRVNELNSNLDEYENKYLKDTELNSIYIPSKFCGKS
ncbi:hypothetical protein [Clostridium sp. VAP51]|uniref:phosphoribosyltransferase-like protein n=1 Tax=Clostridium sp. VAP51 TaxID=2949978 RepID=UPI00207A3213|nr:hypothetical protein [Clostridium sp. VAP51]